MNWKPIECAPKDGTSILGWTSDGICEVYWCWGEWHQSPCYSTYDGAGSAVLYCQPTHWDTLPEAPNHEQ